jgi:hypothetical protein
MSKGGLMSICFMLMFSMSCMTFAQMKPTNAMQFSRIIATMSESLKKGISSEEYALSIIGGNDEKEFMRNELMRHFPEINWIPTSEKKIVVTPSEMRTIYSMTEQDDVMMRSCGMSATIRIDDSNQSRIISIPAITIVDTIHIDEVQQLQQPSYAFCIGALPNSNWNALDTLVKPMLYVLTLGFSTWLLFNVRTQ